MYQLDVLKIRSKHWTDVTQNVIKNDSNDTVWVRVIFSATGSCRCLFIRKDFKDRLTASPGIDASNISNRRHNFIWKMKVLDFYLITYYEDTAMET